MKVKFIVYSHISRNDTARKLIDNLPKGSILHTDNGSGHAKVSYDVLKAMSPDPRIDYLVLLEDDVILCQDFEESVYRALEANIEKRIVTFFSISKEVKAAYEKDLAWIKSISISWLQCVAYPMAKIPKLLAYYQPEKFFDNIISAYCYGENDYCLQTVPNLVQHMELKSTIGNPTTLGGRSRTSKCFHSAKDVNFNRNYFAPVRSIVQKKREDFAHLIPPPNEREV